MKTAIFDVATGIETIRELTADELAVIDEQEKEIAETVAQEAQSQAQKTSATKKLKALGLTAAEIEALTGS